MRLAGPDAVETWPFDGPVHVISAANPHGRRIPDGDNVVELGNLARSLTLEGIGYVRASGEASDGTWGEDSLLVWSIERDQARWFGRQFGQEAIFELTTDELRVIECFGDDVLPQARRPTLTAGADGSTT